MVMKVLDLFCGLGGWSQAFADAGHDCTGIDIKDLGYHSRFIKADITDWQPDQGYDVILASPPCNHFSIISYYFTGKNNHMKGLDLVWRTFHLIEKIKPKYWAIENVKGLSWFLPPPTDIIRYGKNKCRKEAYIWTNFGSLPMFETMLIKKTSRRDFRVGNPELGRIPYQMSKAVLDITQKTPNE